MIGQGLSGDLLGHIKKSESSDKDSVPIILYKWHTVNILASPILQKKDKI